MLDSDLTQKAAQNILNGLDTLFIHGLSRDVDRSFIFIQRGAIEYIQCLIECHKEGKRAGMVQFHVPKFSFEFTRQVYPLPILVFILVADISVASVHCA